MSEPAASPEAVASPPDSTRTGPGRLLIAVYALFALAASARAGVQIATKFGDAPVAYLLSAFAGAVYILATVTLSIGSPAARRIAVLSCSTELVGVLAVGTWSLADPGMDLLERAGLAGLHMALTAASEAGRDLSPLTWTDKDLTEDSVTVRWTGINISYSR